MNWAVPADCSPRGMINSPIIKHPLIITEQEKSKHKKVCQSMSGDLPPAATPPLSAKTSLSHQLMASLISHTFQHPKAYHLQGEHGQGQSHLVSLPVGRLMVSMALDLYQHLAQRLLAQLHHQVHSNPHLHPWVILGIMVQLAMPLCCLDYVLVQCRNEANTQTQLAHSVPLSSPQTGHQAENAHRLLPVLQARDQTVQALQLNHPFPEKELGTTICR